ncbi:hypothetical protein D9757_011697 [Collybiopsis confluens]|uniref:Uncharacterized protein n=1 Tax=Collybiopsis confluens TaxID=2823264 RepID=A0A8H5LRZ9_9AGAR|nr:hypothetical protein D9757_011697 [Collybiopsis confluens]
MELPCGTVLKLVRRDLVAASPLRRYTTMFEHSIPENFAQKAAVVDEEHGFMLVYPDTSVLFYSGDHREFTYKNIHLVVIRNVAMSPDRDTTTDGEKFYRWLVNVIDYACDVRRNQRPNHPGQMTQVGLSMGSRHKRRGPASAKQYGWAKKTAHDEDVIAASGIMWSLTTMMMPAEVTEPVVKTLSELDIPRLATRYVQPGKGFRLELDGRQVVFPDVSRLPPEIYLTRGYSAWVHDDECFAPTAFSFTAGREPPRTAPENGIRVPSYGGANFVHLRLRVIVINSAGSLFSWDPREKHGTTVAGGTTNHIIACTFSKKISDIVKELGDRQNYGISEWGAGQGNLDHDPRVD